MKTVKILGSGCKNCQVTADIVEKTAAQAGIEIEMVKVTDVQDIMAYGVMKTPAVVIDEQVVHKGSVPKEDEAKIWFA
ncbi:thioredoxin family protein [Reinekea marinisedimentorum]|uniref:Small redox-active disulfide protein 2 n=1 Tax=Reinekea marinisedimentorum TaxID=230495 RepID=A0A4V2UIF0_9GAMM|nr:thioredoxin family protein [Reinekea marinisedimentorum]TCS35900.1 small redox-active disulfide protein 2 [Reinekea marinisedimentorum]